MSTSPDRPDYERQNASLLSLQREHEEALIKSGTLARAVLLLTTEQIEDLRRLQLTAVSRTFEAIDDSPDLLTLLSISFLTVDTRSRLAIPKIISVPVAETFRDTTLELEPDFNERDAQVISRLAKQLVDSQTAGILPNLDPHLFRIMPPHNRLGIGQP